MKIIFICGSIEPGQDGVGDYSRRLAGELIRQGHQVAIIALHDKNVSVTLNELQESEGSSIAVLRIPNNIEEKKRFNVAEKFIINFNPEWLSLQYVPFSFQEKGLPFRLASQLAQISNGRKWHIMFHELWVEPINPKRRILGILQKTLVKKLHRKLLPQITHTSVPIYRKRLHSIGVIANDLNLFSNISVISKKDEIGCGGVILDKQVIKICFFSQVTDREEIFLFLDQLTASVIHGNLKFQIVLLGGNEQSMINFALKLEEYPNLDGNIIRTGHLDPPEISQILQHCHLGLSPVPRHFLGKSGSAIAFLTHGVPVAAPYIEKNFNATDIGFFDTPIFKAILLEPTLDKLNIAIKKTNAVKPFFSLQTIANKFIADLKEY